MSIGGCKHVGIDGRRIEQVGICSGRVRFNRNFPRKVIRIIGQEDQRETGGGNLYGAGVIVVAGDGVDMNIVLQLPIALEVSSEGLIGPSDVPRGRTVRQEVFHLDGRWRSSGLSARSSSKGKVHDAHRGWARVRDVVEQGEFGKYTLLPNPVCGGICIPSVGSQVENARRVGLSKGFGKDQRGVEHGSDRPLVVSGLGGRGRVEGVIVNVLSTNVEEGFGEVGIRQLETIIRGPQRGTERVADPLESTTRGRVRLKHMEGLSDRLSHQRGRDVLTGEALDVTVVEVTREFGLRVLGGSEGGIDSTTVVVGVPKEKSAPSPKTLQHLAYLSTLRIFNCEPNAVWKPVFQTSLGCQSAEAIEGPMRLFLSVIPSTAERALTTVWNSLK